MGVLTSVLSVLFVILCILLILVILLQADKGAGMGILGGAGQSTFGSSTADIITKITAWMVILFMVGSLTLAILESKRASSLKSKILSSEPAESGMIQKQDQTSENGNGADKKDK
ncbi:MAG TPA: preprotein translocase subunit SecG [Spirochaetota bacterium]|jgi:preprotein translocase subunit SecG|nr:preprotein translocase subunit SecG [Spirochaetota bacterium]HPX92142.1 preprotein translocase subunit SecG [Spirochaetota bacterium]HRU66199.1 preprotein translocase subunit SecG [Spirochaetota bacterium]